MDKACVYLAQNILMKLKIESGNVRNVDDIDVKLLSMLFNRICVPFMEQPPTLPPIKKPGDYVESMLDILSTEFLNIDLSLKINASEIVEKNVNSLHALLEIFDNLLGCFLSESSSSNGKGAKLAKRKPDLVPQHLRAKLWACGKKSAIYSPRTAYFRRSSAKPIQPEQSSSSLCNPDLTALKKCGLSSSDLRLVQLSNSVHRAKFQNLLHRLKKENDKSEHELKLRLAKISLNRAVNRRVVAASDRRCEYLAFKSAKVTYENCLKQRKRRIVEKRPCKVQTSSSREQTDAEFAFNRFQDADRQAQKLLAEFSKKQAADERNLADSVENRGRDRLQLINEKFTS